MYRHYSGNLRKAINTVFHDNVGAGLAPALKANVSRFAAHKAYHATQIARRERVDKTTGEIFPQDKTAKATLAQFQAWQQAEYNTTVARARTAKQWELYNEPDRLRLFPNIKWLPSGSAEQRPEHQAFYNRIWAKDDPFWATNTPGTLWNCKCGMQETDDDVTDNDNVKISKPPLGLEGNPGITGEIFTEKASYFQKAEVYGQTREEINSICNKTILKDHKAWAAENLKGKKVTPAEFGREIEFSNGGIKEYLDQPHDNYFAKNEMIRDIPHILKNATYRGVTEHKGRKSHIFEITITGKTNYLIANEHSGKGVVFYSVTASNKVLIGIKK